MRDSPRGVPGGVGIWAGIVAGSVTAPSLTVLLRVRFVPTEIGQTSAR